MNADRPSKPRLLPRFGGGRTWLAAPAILLVGIGVIGPVAVLIGYSVGLMGSGAVLGLSHYVEILTDSFYLKVFADTLEMAGVVALASLLLGYPLALVISHSSGLPRTLLIATVVTPLLTNIVVRTLGWLVILSKHGILNSVLDLISPSLETQYLGSLTGIAIGLTHVGIPMVVLPLLGSLDEQDRSLREAAATAGAHPLTVFWRITLPLSAPGIVAGTTLAFVLGVAALVSPMILGGGRAFVVSTLMVQQIQTLEWGRAAAIALVLFAIVFVAVSALQWLAHRVSPTAVGRRAHATRPLAASFAILNRLPGFSPIGRWLRRIFVVLVVGFLLLPLFVVLKSAFDVNETMHAGFEGFTLKWFADALDPNGFLPSLLLSLRLAAFVVAIGTVVAIPAALTIARGVFPGRHALLTFLMSPLLLPQSALAIGFVLFFQLLHVGPSIWRLLLAHLVVAFPYMMRVLVSGLMGMDVALEEAAASLGASRLMILRRVTLPLIRSSIFAAILFAFVVSFDEATISVLVAGASISTLPVKIFSELSVQFTPAVAAISALLIGFVIIVMIPLERRLGITTAKPKGDLADAY